MEKNRPKTTFTLPHLRAIPVAIGYILNSLEVKVVYCPLEKSPKDVRTPKGPIPSTVKERKEVIYSISVLDYSSTCTLDRLVGASSSESLNTAVLRRMGKFKHPIYRIWHAVHLRQLEILDRTSTPLYATCLRASTSITTRQS